MRIVDGMRKRALLEELERRGFARVVDVFLVTESVESDALGRDLVFLRDLQGATEDKDGHRGIDFACRADERRFVGKFPDQKPRIDGDAVSADAGTGI